MIRLAANLSFLFAERPFLDRFAAAKRAGFSAVEFTFVYDIPAGAIAQQCREHGLIVALLNAPPGNLAIGEAGMAALPGRRAETRAGFLEALGYADLLGARAIHLLAGNVPQDADRRILHDTYVENLRWAADLASSCGVMVTIEPLNAEDRPDYYLRTAAQACRIIRAVDRPNIRLQLDLYHCQKTEGAPAKVIQAALPMIGHVQVASARGRHEPDESVIGQILLLDRLGYGGFIGCEYLPAGETEQGLGWASNYLQPEKALSI